jgi:integrase/recombinase XerD
MVGRIFARHLRAFDPATKVPPADALPCHYRRVTPYLYSPAQIDTLMRAAGTLGPPRASLAEWASPATKIRAVGAH